MLSNLALLALLPNMSKCQDRRGLVLSTIQLCSTYKRSRALPMWKPSSGTSDFQLDWRPHDAIWSRQTLITRCVDVRPVFCVVPKSHPSKLSCSFSAFRESWSTGSNRFLVFLYRNTSIFNPTSSHAVNWYHQNNEWHVEKLAGSSQEQHWIESRGCHTKRPRTLHGKWNQECSNKKSDPTT